MMGGAKIGTGAPRPLTKKNEQKINTPADSYGLRLKAKEGNLAPGATS